MLTDKQAKKAKERCLHDIRQYIADECYEKYPGANAFFGADARLLLYIKDCVREDADRANLFELLGIRKILRMVETYPFDRKKAKHVLYTYEGAWVDGIHLDGGLRFSGLKGRTYYQLTPLQVWELAVPFGFMRAEEDWRRKFTECVYFIPRKSSKTTLAAFIQVWFFLFEDYNNEGYCIANSQGQSKILFDLTYDLLHQLDPKEKRIRFTNTEINWKTGQPRACKIMALTAGGKTKDGLFAGLACADEYGSASYVNEKSDMANLLQVVEGSMGARREPLTVITTTAGRVNQGPFQLKLEGIKDGLLKELDHPLTSTGKPMTDDWQFSLLCCPDQWEQDDESLQKPDIWYKVNRHIGITVQSDYYENEWTKMRKDEEKKKEQITKLFNVFQSARTRPWITPDQILKLQGRHDISALKNEKNWVCFVGMDFSRGDDLCGMAYLCHNLRTKAFFADCDMWITSKALESHANAVLYRQFVEGGWLHVCPGEIINEMVITDRVADIIKIMRVLRFGYDPYDSKLFINHLNTWLRMKRINPDKMVVPVRQTWGNFNSATQCMERLVTAKKIEFCQNPIFPWCFGNAKLEVDRMENIKPVKANPNGKIDPVICLIEGIIEFEGMGGVV